MRHDRSSIQTMINLEPVGRMVPSRRSVSTVFAEEAPYLKMLPSEYIKSGRVYFGVECGEKTIPDGVRWGLEHTVLYSSDYPLGRRLAAHHQDCARAPRPLRRHQAQDAPRQCRALLQARA